MNSEFVNIDIHCKEIFPPLPVPQRVWDAYDNLYNQLFHHDLIDSEVKKGLEIIKGDIRSFARAITSMSARIEHDTYKISLLISCADTLASLSSK